MAISVEFAGSGRFSHPSPQRNSKSDAGGLPGGIWAVRKDELALPEFSVAATDCLEASTETLETLIP
jgi:hypothetical protein